MCPQPGLFVPMLAHVSSHVSRSGPIRSDAGLSVIDPEAGLSVIRPEADRTKPLTQVGNTIASWYRGYSLIRKHPPPQDHHRVLGMVVL